MSRSARRFCWAALGLFGLGSLAQAADAPARLPAKAGRIETYATADGEGYFALELTPAAAEPPRTAHDLAILFDTSASQTGSYREKALAVLDGLLAHLDERDRVLLLAVDLQAIPLTQTFVSARSQELSQALARLRERVPLGSTDMPAALAAAATHLAGGVEADRAHSAIYLGDGMSTARLLFTENMRRLMERFLEARISVSSYSIGPRVDHELLGAVAHHTGGVLLSDREDLEPAELGARLAEAARTTVVWPSAVKLPEGYWPVYFREMPPLRFDRDTVLLGKMPAGGDDSKPAGVEIEVRGEAGGKPIVLRWKLTPEPPATENAYLARLVEAARRDGGLSLPIVGAAGLSELRGRVNGEAARLARLGRQALALGEVERAERFAQEAKRLDPLHAQVVALVEAVQTAQRGGRLKAETLPLELRPLGTPAHSEPAQTDASRRGRRNEPLDEAAKRRLAYERFLRREIENSVRASQAMAASDPDGAAKLLKRLKEQAAQAAQLDPHVRSQLDEQIETALKAAGQQALVKEELARRRQRSGDGQQTGDRPAAETPDEEQKIDGLVERFNALMDDEHYRDAAAEASAAQPSPASSTANAVADARHKAEIEALHQGRSSRFPTPDEPPLVYADANVWRVLSERRRQAEAADPAENDSNDARLLAALDEPTELDFNAQPLADVVSYLRARHGIEIEFDRQALSRQNIAADAPVTRRLKGVALRSALRLLLSEMDLTFVIRNQALWITTKAAAETMRSPKIYSAPGPTAPFGTPSAGGTGIGRRGLGRGL